MRSSRWEQTLSRYHAVGVHEVVRFDFPTWAQGTAAAGWGSAVGQPISVEDNDILDGSATMSRERASALPRPLRALVRL
jgi:hypothetical protein